MMKYEYMNMWTLKSKRLLIMNREASYASVFCEKAGNASRPLEKPKRWHSQRYFFRLTSLFFSYLNLKKAFLRDDEF